MIVITVYSVFMCYSGDTAKYFLYVYHSDSDEELDMSKETDQLENTSTEYEAEQSKHEGWYYLTTDKK